MGRGGTAMIVALATIVLVGIVPLTFYYLGTVGGVSFSGMAVNLVAVGVFLVVLFIAFVAVKQHMGR